MLQQAVLVSHGMIQTAHGSFKNALQISVGSFPHRLFCDSSSLSPLMALAQNRWAGADFTTKYSGRHQLYVPMLAIRLRLTHTSTLLWRD